MPHPHRILTPLILLISLFAAATARAQPWFGFHDNDLEDCYADGDIDEEDILAMDVGRRHGGSTDVHNQSWFSIGGSYSELPSGQRDYTAMAIVGVALDKVAAGPTHRAREEIVKATLQKEKAANAAQAKETARGALDPKQAHSCVAAAWRAYGLGEDDENIDAMIARSRASAALPELRLRVSRLMTDDSHTTTSVVTDGSSLYDVTGSNLTLEARMTWRLDRLLFANDEPQLERLRLERQAARARVSAAVLRALFQWQRAKFDEKKTVEDTPERDEAELKVTETEALLDVLTKGWFSKSRIARGHD